MAVEFEIQVRNGKVTIRVGGGQPNATKQGGSSLGDASSDTSGGGSKGGTSPIGPDPGTGGGTPGSGSGCCCCAHVVIGQILVDGSYMQGGGGQSDGGSSPIGPDPGAGGGRPGSDGGTSPIGPDPGTGGGTPGSGSGCCCAPVVIGPIVFSGCRSGQTGASDPAVTTAKAVTVNPPQRPLNSARVIPPVANFTMQKQAQTNWCWSAVAVSINTFFNPQGPLGGPTWTQDTLATKLLDPKGTDSLNCSLDEQGSTVCNRPEALDAALTITGDLLRDGYLQSSYLTFDCLQNWINEQFPVCARIVWRGGGAHFIALDGCAVTSSGEQRVHVQDPDPNVAPVFWDYDELVEHYRDGGYWHDLYLVTT